MSIEGICANFIRNGEELFTANYELTVHLSEKRFSDM